MCSELGVSLVINNGYVCTVSVGNNWEFLYINITHQLPESNVLVKVGFFAYFMGFFLE